LRIVVDYERFCREASVELVNFNVPGKGAYAVISYPRFEHFDLPVLGCLYAARLHRQVSVRCPKGSVNTNLQCDLQVGLYLYRRLPSAV